MLVINIVGLSLITFIVWWFWLFKPKGVESKAEDLITLIVENGIYQPSKINFPSNKPVNITFLRKDPSPCAAMVLFPDFNITRELQIDLPTIITLPAMPEGEYAFHCQMQMYRGSIIVV